MVCSLGFNVLVCGGVRGANSLYRLQGSSAGSLIVLGLTIGHGSFSHFRQAANPIPTEACSRRRTGGVSALWL